MPDQVSNNLRSNPLLGGASDVNQVNPTPPAPPKTDDSNVDRIGGTAASGGVSPNQAAVAGDNLLSLREQLLQWTKTLPNAEAIIQDGRNQLDRTNPDSASVYASGAQKAAAAVSERMLEGVRVKDTGAGTSKILQDAMTTMKGLDPKIDPKDNSIWDKVVGFFKGQKWAIERAIVRFDTEQGTVLKTLSKLRDQLGHKKLAHEVDIQNLEKLRDATLVSFETLGHRIAAGHVELEEARAELAAVNAQVAKEPQNPELLGKQNTLKQYTQLLDRRIHALAKAFAFARQQIPGIEAMQQNSRDLHRGITTFQDQVLPTWKQMLAQATVL
ncbi:MAG: toxic anion resistance protein, partial [Myxococcota bacterium]